MKLCRLFISFLITAFFITGCIGYVNQETPLKFASRFYQNMADNKADEVFAMFDLSEEEAPLLQSKLILLVAEISKEINAQGGIERVEIIDQTAQDDGRKVNLDLLIHFGDGSSKNDHMQLIKTDTGWKIT